MEQGYLLELQNFDERDAATAHANSSRAVKIGDPQQRTIDANTTRTLRKLIDELSPRRRTLIRMLFTDSPCSYNKLSRIAGIPLGGIGPTRARALRQLRDKLDEHEVGPGA